MKLYKYILFYIFYIIINREINVVKSVNQCTSPILDLIIKDSCGLDSSKLIINQDDFSLLDIINLSQLSPPQQKPLLQPTYNINNKAFEWNLIDGIDYLIEYRYKGCNGNGYTNKQIVKSNGMYYKLKTQPLCLYTQFNFTIYNFNSYGDSKEFQATPSNIKISNQDNTCTLNFFITPISITKGALQNNIISYTHPTCGFKNGTISITIPKSSSFSNYHLFFKNDLNLQNEIKSISPSTTDTETETETEMETTIKYINLDSDEYLVFIDSDECGREKIKIKLDNVYPQINLELNHFSNSFYNNSIMSFNDNQSSINFNKSNLVLFYGSQNSKFIKKVQQQQLKNDNFQDVFYKDLTFGYYYNKDLSINPTNQLLPSICIFQQYSSNTRSLPQINYTIINGGDENNSCLNMIKIEINSLYGENDEIILTSITDNLIYKIEKLNISNNNNNYYYYYQSYIPYNNEFKITSLIGKGDIYFSTIYKKLTYKIIETSSIEQIGCWKTFNITIYDFQDYKDLKLIGSNEVLIYPSVEGVFINVPSNQLTLSYYYGDCITESRINIAINDNDHSNFGLHSDYNPLDNVKIDYSIIKNSTCFTPAIIQYSVNSPLGILNGTFETDDEYENFIKFPNSLCFIPLSYSTPNTTPTTSPTTTTSIPIDFSYKVIKTPSCSIDQSGLISIRLNDRNFVNSNLIYKIESNGEILIQHPSNHNNYFIKSGENKIKITLKIGNKFCVSSIQKSINIPKINSINPKVLITPITNCENSNGKIEILNYQEFTTIELYSIINNKLLNSINNGSTFYNLESSNYILNFKSLICSGSIIVNVPSSSSSNDKNSKYKITPTIIRNPTCSNGNSYSDGRIGISLIKDGNKINNFTISNINDNHNYYFTNGIYEIATVGLNQLIIKYGSCKWYENITLEFDDPKFKIQNLFNQTCGFNYNLYKIISNNSNVQINKITYVTATDYTNYQNEHFISNPFRFPLIYTIRWNDLCENTFTQYYDINNNNDINNQQINVKYEIVYPNDCLSSSSSSPSFKFDIIIKNMNSFKSLLLYGRVPTISINSTHSIFKNVVPSETYEFTYTSLYGCDGIFYIYKDDLPKTNVNQKLDIKITNDICHSGLGSIQFSNFDNDNYYYYLRSLKLNYKENDNDVDHSYSIPIYNANNNNNYNNNISNNNNNYTFNLKVGTYNIYRGCKSMINCIIDEKITIGNDDPVIESINLLDSFNSSKNGSVEVKLNFNSSFPIVYEIVGTKFSNLNDGKFLNLPPNSYELKIIITDKMCPIVLTKNFTINLIPTEKTNRQPSNSTILKFNYLLFLIGFLIIIIF
ncbi:hypothetical protein DDB_G0271482 [Dictyostelium discoideum AX4]|uniref:Uncharacterized protein n=1 Tax=Dictyostelium discoideum TaxID=44689 RepID=Q55B14_DICDI|nr:hypothetical protein DDB_G0271482 [Dictyostelium discoideum AX4]EAL71871.1 hypothetical protein DDB_G0271482 [Dictyostelium discoideum AX4]|eukprot:XP_645798.1 hypothetical protein DDB_G0271482 [Dictyostelium discoideum AX4]